MPMPAQSCESKRRDGQPCQMAPLTGSRYCFTHDPANRTKRSFARKLGGHRRSAVSAGDVGIEELSFRDSTSILTLLEHVAADAMRRPHSLQKARTLGYLCGIALKTLEVAEFEERLLALEQTIKRKIS